MNCLITGGLGFIGYNLQKRLIDKNYNVHVWDNLYTGNIENLHEKSIFTKTDCSDITDNFDVIFHLAGFSRVNPSFTYPKEAHLNNVNATVSILELARKTGAKVIFAGTSCMYDNLYANPYVFTKWIGEEYCKLYNRIWGVSIAIARFFNVYGTKHIAGEFGTVLALFEDQYRKGLPLTITGTGEQRRDMIHVDDVIDGLLLIADKNWNTEVFNLGFGKNWSINEIANLFKTKVEYIPKRSGEAMETLANIEFTKRVLGFNPKIHLEDYVEKFLKTV